MFFAYLGFDAVSTAAQKARNPQRDMDALVVWLAVGLVVHALYSRHHSVLRNKG